MWFPSPFQDVHEPSKYYPTAEHYFLHHRALLFGDDATAAAILATASPHQAKVLARRTKNFDAEVWRVNRERIARDANWYKFTCRPVPLMSPHLPCGSPWFIPCKKAISTAADLRTALLETGERQIVLAHPMDEFWGTGRASSKAWARRGGWGLNKMGICLMELRERLRNGEGGP
ncbi:hypothetical protein F4776DRAFT_658988 [Hypoxylon sp. NC0597]|nr:hypothetical protein F4776DRAFT_658988 [Hypoxylon sp. NC0597]